jgi:hypothetical protein
MISSRRIEIVIRFVAIGMRKGMTVIKRINRKWLLISILIVVATLPVIYIRSHPLVFNESLWRHAHCIKIAGLALEMYAQSNSGRFPSDSKGYGNALLLLNDEDYFALTGPGYDVEAFHVAKKNGLCLSEKECGRVYVQGLTKRSNPELALLFDKLATPGGDHCHLPRRLWAPSGREVLFVGGDIGFVEETEWADFAMRQVDLLLKEGFRREEAERLFSVDAE